MVTIGMVRKREKVRVVEELGHFQWNIYLKADV